MGEMGVKSSSCVNGLGQPCRKLQQCRNTRVLCWDILMGHGLSHGHALHTVSSHGLVFLVSELHVLAHGLWHGRVIHVSVSHGLRHGCVTHTSSYTRFSHMAMSLSHAVWALSHDRVTPIFKIFLVFYFNSISPWMFTKSFLGLKNSL